MLLSALLAALALTGTATLTVVYVLAVLLGTAQVFDAPGRQALTYQMVGRDELPNAIALNSSLFNMSRVVGPALAGLVIAAAGSGVCFILNAISFLAVLAGLLAMRTDELYRVERKEPPTLIRGTREGIAYVLRSHDTTLVLAIVTVMSTVGFNFNVILPLLASNTLHSGSLRVRAAVRVFRNGRARRRARDRDAWPSQLARPARRSLRVQRRDARAGAVALRRGLRPAAVRPRRELHGADRERQRARPDRRTRATSGDAWSASISSPSPGWLRSAASSRGGSSQSAAPRSRSASPGRRASRSRRTRSVTASESGPHWRARPSLARSAPDHSIEGEDGRAVHRSQLVILRPTEEVR